MKNFLTLVLILASCMCLLSCTSDNNEPSFSLTLSDVVGVWNVTEMTENGETENIPSGQVTIDLDNDNSYQVKFFSNTYIGTYHLSENTVVGTTLDPITEIFKFTKYDGINATIQYSNSVGDKYIFKATKKTYARVSLNYTFAESGSLSRATGADVYNNFYEKYIKTKILTPKSYSLKFTHKETGATATINGLWENKDMVRLVEGEYYITGTSSPKPKGVSYQSMPSDTVFLSFNEDIVVTKDMTSLNLTAIYDSYLILFDNTNYSNINFYHSGNGTIDNPLFMTDEVFSLFIRDFNYKSADYIPQIKATRIDNKSIIINLNKFPFEKGKYYYFNDMTNSFDIPPMESGN